MSQLKFWDGTDWEPIEVEGVVPDAGDEGQVLTKSSNTDFDLEWADAGRTSVGTTAPDPTTGYLLWVDTS